jgi:hypothetical protein
MHLSSINNEESGASEIDGNKSSPEPEQRDSQAIKSNTEATLSQEKTKTEHSGVSIPMQQTADSWVPPHNIEVIERLNKLSQSDQQRIFKVTTLNCQAACFEFYSRNSLWRTKFSDKDNPLDRKLFELDNRKPPKHATDFDLVEWIAKIRHVFITRINAHDSIPYSAIGDVPNFRTRMEVAEKIPSMWLPWGELKSDHCEGLLLVAISFCANLRSWDCEARLKRLLAQIRQPSAHIDFTHLYPLISEASKYVEPDFGAKKRRVASKEDN